MKVSQISEQQWIELFKSEYFSMLFDPKYLNIVKDAFGYDLHYYAALKGNNIRLAAAIFVKGTSVVRPDAFTYNSIYFDSTIGDIAYVDLMNNFLQLLSSNFNKISLRLPPSFFDLRPFIWCGFKVQNRYTYIRDVSAPLSHKIEKRIKAIEDTLVFREEVFNDQLLQYCVDQCFEYDAPDNEMDNYSSLFRHLANHHYLRAFCVYDGKCLKIIRFALIDAERSTLSTILTHNLYSNKLIPFLNKELFNWCLANNIKYVDMVGANNEGIANFKASFNAKLTPYYLVDYKRSAQWYGSIINSAKRRIKRLLKW